MSMKMTVQGQQAIFEGILNESNRPDDIHRILKQAESASSSQQPDAQDLADMPGAHVEDLADMPGAHVDMAQVEGYNSVGLNHWLKGCRNLDLPLIYSHCPAWLVDQFNQLNDFFAPNLMPNGVFVDRVEVLYYNDDIDQLISRYLRLGSDVPILKDYSTFVLEPVKNHEGHEFQPINESWVSFAFVSQLTQQQLKFSKNEVA